MYFVFYKWGKHVVILRNYTINTSEFYVMLMSSWQNSALKSTTCPLQSRVLRLTEADSLRPDSSRTSPGNEIEKQSRPERLYGKLRWSGRNLEHGAGHDETSHDTVTWNHYCDVIMGVSASQITSLMIVYSTVYSDADQREFQSSASLAFVRGIHRGPGNSPHKWPVTRKNVSIWWRHHVCIHSSARSSGV